MRNLLATIPKETDLKITFGSASFGYNVVTKQEHADLLENRSGVADNWLRSSRKFTELFSLSRHKPVHQPGRDGDPSDRTRCVRQPYPVDGPVVPEILCAIVNTYRKIHSRDTSAIPQEMYRPGPCHDESNHEFLWPSRNNNSEPGVSTHKTCRYPLIFYYHNPDTAHAFAVAVPGAAVIRTAIRSQGLISCSAKCVRISAQRAVAVSTDSLHTENNFVVLSPIIAKISSRSKNITVCFISFFLQIYRSDMPNDSPINKKIKF